jgi:curved DNA-binding protein CbpA
MEQQDHYAVLGVDPDASDVQLKVAYRRLARQWHPDRCEAPDAEQRFAQISEAYRVLSDVDSRAAYDRTRPVLTPGAMVRETQQIGVDDLLGTLFAKPAPKPKRDRAGRRR